ncbi:MAG: FRG domain-containing protein [Chloroflexi bacterium]|nr:FRG domain-containing protein [Chloroflexota bacterium]
MLKYRDHSTATHFEETYSAWLSFGKRRFTSAIEFLSALRLSNSTWRRFGSSAGIPDLEWSRQWIFRGQSSAKCPLRPKAWRPDENMMPKNEALRTIWNAKWHNEEFAKEVRRKIEPYGSRESDPLFFQELERTLRGLVQAFSELQLINEFTELADELGFAVETLPSWTKKDPDYDRYYEFIDKYWNLHYEDKPWDNHSGEPPPIDKRLEFWRNPTIALAQHHGIATRLLDWTRNPLTAAFFAANSAKSSGVEDSIVVYAVHRRLLEEHIRCVEVPASGNNFLRSQSGLFTVDLNGEDYLNKYGQFPSFEQSITLLRRNVKPYEYPRKLLLPLKQAQELMRLLTLERVTHAHLMPTLDHVAEAVNTRIVLSDEG